MWKQADVEGRSMALRLVVSIVPVQLYCVASSNKSRAVMHH